MDTQCVDCASGLKPINSVWTTTGNCAWRCETGFTMDESNGNQSQCVKPRQAAAPPALPAEANVPVVTLQIELPVTKSLFLAQQDSFIEGLARTAGVNPSDVKVVSVTEVSLRRQPVAVRVVTQVRTQEADRVEKALVLDTVNRVLAEAALPPASALRVEVDRIPAPAGEPAPELPTSQPPAVDFRLIILSVGAGFGVLIISATVLMWYRRSRLWRSDRRICTCHLQGCNLHNCQPLPVVIKGSVQEFVVPVQTQERAPVQTTAASHQQSKNLVHGPGPCSSQTMVDETDSIFVDIPLEPAARRSAPLQSSAPLAPLKSSRGDRGFSKSSAAGELSFVAANVPRPTGKVYESDPRATRPRATPQGLPSDRGKTGYTPGNGGLHRLGKTPNPFRNPAISTARHGHFYPPEMPASESTSSQLLGGKSSSFS